MKCLCFAALTAVLCAAGARAEEETAPAAAREQPPDANLTVITSKRLTFDYQQKYAFFEENVVVVDPEMKLAADTMTVRFNEEGDIESIVAKGNVRIDQADKTSWSGVATYEVGLGKLTLEDNPRVARGKDLLTGDIITFWRDQNKMVCEPQARLVIYPEEGESKDQLFGE